MHKISGAVFTGLPAPHHWRKYIHQWCFEVENAKKTPRAEVNHNQHEGHVRPGENHSKINHVNAREEHHGSHGRNRIAYQGSPRSSQADEHHEKREVLAGHVIKSAKARVRGDVALANAVMFGQVWQAEKALEPPNAAAINQPFQHTGMFPLLSAARYASDKEMPKDVKAGAMVRMLLEHKADINAVDDDGANAMMHAVHAGSLEVALILEGLLDMTTKDSSGRTMLMFAVMSDNISVCSFVLDRCCLKVPDRKKWLEEVDTRGWNVGHHAAQCGANHSLRWIDIRHPELLNTAVLSPKQNKKSFSTKSVEPSNTRSNGKTFRHSRDAHEAWFGDH